MELLFAMVFPYGVGIGDFIAGIETTIKICKACRVTGGASDKYKSLVEDLRVFEEILKSLKQPPQGSIYDLDHEEIVQNIVKSCEGLVLDFREKLLRYDNQLGNHTTGAAIGAVKCRLAKASEFGKKAKFALVMPEDIESFRINFFTKIWQLNLFLMSALT